jgi:pimeloyl-ACP methyl ester carboxylesterase
LTRDDVSGRLGEITCPALVVHGTEDTAISMADAEAMAAGLVGCGGVVKVGGAHAANLTNPEPVNAAILDFLAGLPA